MKIPQDKNIANLDLFRYLTKAIILLSEKEVCSNKTEGLELIEGHECRRHLSKLGLWLKERNTPDLEIFFKLIIRNFQRSHPRLSVEKVYEICKDIWDDKTEIKNDSSDPAGFKPYTNGHWEFRLFSREIYYKGRLFSKPGDGRWILVQYLIGKINEGITKPESDDFFDFHLEERLREQREEGKHRGKELKKMVVLKECGFKHNSKQNKIWNTLIKSGKEGQKSIVFFDFSYIPTEKDFNN